ncbi:MAG: flagellar hook assembly protein FlgD [Acidobacteria bacterium]|nr:flagellar hook assembly protein FlgD [Acidobacteriota bacterium]
METALVSSSTAPQGTPTSPNNALDKNAFLKLLVAQLKNQDPSNTQDPNQMVQQLTSFSNLEQLANLGTLLEGIQVQNQGLFQAQVASLVGKRIRVPGNSVNLKDGKATIGISLPSDAKNVTITIKDATGKVVRTLPQGSLKAGQSTVDWDGMDAQGAKLADGDYTVEITATGTDGKAIDAKTTCYVKVDAVTFKAGVVYLVAGGKTYTLSEVTEIAA